MESNIPSTISSKDLPPATQKVFWKSSLRDHENIDLDEIKALPDRDPIKLSDDEELSQTPSSVSQITEKGSTAINS